MKVSKEYAGFFHHLNAGERATLSDAQTKLYILVESEMYYVDVDHGIIKNSKQNIKKCDFLCYDALNKNCHLIELKGAVIKEAQKQISATLGHIKANGDISFLLEGLQFLDAYIVSPGRQEVPKGVDDVKRRITRELAKFCSVRLKNIDILLKFVRVVPKSKSLSERDGHIICSNAAPLRF